MRTNLTTLCVLAALLACGACERGVDADKDTSLPADGGTDGGTDADTGTASDDTDIDAGHECPTPLCDSPCVRRVDADRNADAGILGDGLTWATAFAAVEEGLDAAECEVQGCGGTCAVWVAEGVYYTYRKDPRDTVTLRPGVQLVGGFDGTEQSVVERDVIVHTTILDGRDKGRGMKQVYHVVTGANGASLDGFVVRNGDAGGGALHEKGGGMLNVDASPAVRNCKFSENRAANGGGGIYNLRSSPHIENTLFDGNRATGLYESCDMKSCKGRGAGMLNEDSAPTLSSAAFLRNRADLVSEDCEGTCTGDGGGMLNDRSSPEVMDTMFIGNRGEGMLNVNSSAPDVSRTLFFGNAIGMRNRSSFPTVSTAVFANNSSTDVGGGMSNEGSAPVVSDSLFVGNDGGGMGNINSAPVVTSSVFVGNFGGAGPGGGMFNMGSSPMVINCTFVGNRSYGEAAGAIWSELGGAPVVAGSILWGNVSPEIAGSGVTADVTYSDVAGGHAGDGNIDADPIYRGFPAVASQEPDSMWYDEKMFITTLEDSDETWTPGELAGLSLLIWSDAVSPYPLFAHIIDNAKTRIMVLGDITAYAPGASYEVYDFRLAAGSPCIDAADGDVAPSFDALGREREDDPATPNTGGGVPDYADMGAFEYQSQP
ncbi:MAG: choice-of-anchor Q domain-containing protein [Deltaproteobacteria bacterium]|nr:choice-of-anchor Q domain-containing protein [Deltaproteobacteria bacterium]